MKSLLQKDSRIRLPMPWGVRFMTCCLALLAVLLIFRMPPLSLSASKHYYELDGSATAAILKNTRAYMKQTLKYGAFQTIINADVHVPLSEHIAIYKARNAPVDMGKAVKAFYPDDQDFNYIDNVESHPGLFYGMTFQEVMGESSFFEVIENGRLDFFFHGEELVSTPEEALAFVRKAGIAPGEVQVLDLSGEGEYVIRPVVGGLPVGHYDAFDAYTRRVNPAGSLRLQVSGGRPVQLKGNFFQPTELLWASTALVPVEKAIEAVARVQREDIEILEIKLTYQARSILANPFEVILYPMWEFRIKDDKELICLVNAVNGVLELYVSRV